MNNITQIHPHIAESVRQTVAILKLTRMEVDWLMCFLACDDSDTARGLWNQLYEARHRQVKA